MARRMMRKHHVRCRAGEKVAITSKPYLSLSILVECGKMLQRGAPKLGKDGKPMKDKHGKVIYEPYRIKVLNTINFKKSMHYNRATCSPLKRRRTALFLISSVN